MKVYGKNKDGRLIQGRLTIPLSNVKWDNLKKEMRNNGVVSEVMICVK